MTTLFQKVDINGLTLRNRTVRSATVTGLAEEDGRCSDKLIELLEKLAIGEVGLIITGLAYVLPNGQAIPKQLGIHDEAKLHDLLRLTDRIHAIGGKIAMQIGHCGPQTPLQIKPVWGASKVTNTAFECTPQAMTQEDINECVQAFAQAADRVKRAGFDAVQIQAAHGWLISSFLSPNKNKRTDKYGGSIQNRSRFLSEIYTAIRNSVGEDFPVLMKLNCKDFVDDGFEERDALFVAEHFEKTGLDAIEISGGTPEAGSLSSARLNIKAVEDEAYFEPYARMIKAKLSIPIILVAGIKSLEKINQILDNNSADLVSFCRPFIRESNLINRWKEGDETKARCISCNNCYATIVSPDGLHCSVELKKEKGAETTEDNKNEQNFVSVIRKGIEKHS